MTQNCKWLLWLHQRNHATKELAVVNKLSELIYILRLIT